MGTIEVWLNLFAGGEPVLDVKMNSILDILRRLFVGFSLAVAALQGWAGDKISVSVGFDYHWQGQVPHTRIIVDDRAWVMAGKPRNFWPPFCTSELWFVAPRYSWDTNFGI